MRVLAKLVLLGCLCAAGWFGLAAWRDRLGRPNAVVAGAPAVPVRVVTVKTTRFTTYQSAIGAVQAYNMVTVRARVDGQLEAVTFTEGQDVHAGDVLAVIDPRPFQAALEQAEATKVKDEAQLANTMRDLQRYLDLKDFASRQQTETQQALVAQMKAALQGDQAAIDNAKIQLGYATIRAPISGRTGARLIDAGNMIKSSEGLGLLSIAQIEPIYVSFTLPQDLLDTVREAQKAGPVIVEALKSDDRTRISSGTLSLVDNQIDMTTGTIRMKATFANQDHKLWPGAFVNVHVVTNETPDAVTVPQQVVQNGPDGRFVYVVNADMTVSVRPVTDGAARDGIIMIKDGLSPGEKVVLDGQSKLRADSKVVIQDAGPQKTAAR